MAIFCYSVGMIVKIYQYIQQHIHTETFIDYMALLLLLPFVFAIVEYIYIKYASKSHAEKKESLYFTLHSDIVLLVYIGIQFFCISSEKLPIVFALATLAKLSYICITLLLKRTKPKRKKENISQSNKQDSLFNMEGEELSIYPESQQEEETEVSISLEKDVHIEHIYKTLEGLRKQKLTTGDRLECKKIEEILRLYCMKKEFTASEVALLNDILASLLKMMAKYTI